MMNTRIRFICLGLVASLGMALIALACARTRELTEPERRSQALDHLEKGKALEEEKLYARAIQEHLKALDLAPSPQIYYHLGHCYSRLNEYDTAVIYLRKAVEGSPDFSLAYYELLYAEEKQQEIQGGAPAPSGLEAGPALEQPGGRALTAEKLPTPPPAMTDLPPAGEARTLAMATADDFRPRRLLPPPAGAVEQTVRTAPTPPLSGNVGLDVESAPAPPEQLPFQNAPRPAGRPPEQASVTPRAGATPDESGRWKDLLATPAPPAGVRIASSPANRSAAPTPEPMPAMKQVRDAMFPQQGANAAPSVPLDQSGQATLLSDSMFHVSMGDRFMERGDYEKARGEYIDALRKDESNVLARVRLARAFDALNMADRAEEQIQRAVEIQPKDADAATGLAELLYDRRRYDEAKNWAERAVAMRPENADATILLADVNAKLGRSAYAEQLYGHAHELAPESPKPSWKMGLLRLEVKDYDQARKLFERALQIDPKCVPALNNLGVMDHIQGNYKSAESNFKRILEIDPAWAKAHFNLAVLYENPNMLDDRKEAIKQYEKYLELGGGDRDSEARLAIAELKAKG